MCIGNSQRTWGDLNLCVCVCVSERVSLGMELEVCKGGKGVERQGVVARRDVLITSIDVHLQ